MKHPYGVLPALFLVLLGCNGKTSNQGNHIDPPPVNQPVPYQENWEDGKTIKEKYDRKKDAAGNFTKDGKYQRFFKSGKVEVEGGYANDKMDGAWTYYSDAGVKLREEQYVSGVIEGYVIEFYPNGKPSSKKKHVRGKVDGHCVFYHETGFEAYEGTMLGDKKEGTWQYWDEKGNRTRKEEYRDGNLIESQENLVKIKANEDVVVSKLRELILGIENFRASAHVDQDGNKEGEYGFLPELAGTSPLRTKDGLNGPELKDSRYIDQLFGTVDDNGNAEFSGFYFRLYLPGAENAITSNPGVPSGDKASAKNQEKCYALYAWPVSYGVSGKRAFFINQEKRIYQTKNEIRRYEGKTGPQAKAIYNRDDKKAVNLLAELATNQTDKKPNDEQTWYPLE